MAPLPRLNKIITLLQQGKIVFGGRTNCGDPDYFTFLANSNYDFIVIDQEHSEFSPRALRDSLQHLLSRKRIAQAGTIAPDPVPLVRVPSNGREKNQWLIKHILDLGPYGLALPHINTVEEAQWAVASARYAQKPGVKDFQPEGMRGWHPDIAVQYWGVTPREYIDKADVWPLDPDGEMFLIGLIEEAEGIRNLPDILKQVKGIGAIWVGRADMSLTLGTQGDREDPRVEEMVMRVLNDCKQHNVPCAVFSPPDKIAQRIEQGFRIIMSPPRFAADGLESGRKVAGRA